MSTPAPVRDVVLAELAKGPKSSGRLATDLKLNRGSLYVLLNHWRKQGYVRRVGGKGSVYELVPDPRLAE